MLKYFYTYIILFILGVISIHAQESFNTLIYNGNRSFDKKNYEEASSTFSRAAKRKNDDFGAHYNLANALYKKKMYNEAKAEYQKAQKYSQNKEEKMAALYNQGNAHLQSKENDKAVDFYKKALQLDPDNKSILKNLQIAKKKLQERQNPQSQQNQNKNQTQNQDKNGAGENKDNQKNSTPSQENGNLGNQNQGKGTEKQNQPQLPNQKQEGQKIPKDLEKAILRRSEDQEREAAKRLLNKNAYSIPESNAKDW